MKTKAILFLILFIMGISSCNYIEDLFGKEEDQKETMKTNIADGHLILPSQSAVSKNDIKIISFVDKVSAGESDIQKVSVVPTDKPQILYATNKQDELVLLGLVNNTSDKFEISPRTTALSLVLLNPMFLLTSGLQREQIIASAGKHPDFNNLVESINLLLKTDPEHVLDFQVHPKIYEWAAQIAVDILKESQDLTNKSATAELKNPWIESAGTNKICLYNPRTIFYAGSFSPLIDDQITHLIDAKSSLIKIGLKWPPVYFTSPTENIFTIKDGNNYNLVISKGMDFSNADEFFNLNTINGKATLFNTVKSIGFLCDLAVGLQIPVSSSTKLVLSSRKNILIAERLGDHLLDGDVLGIVYDLCDFATFNKNEIIAWLREELNPLDDSNIDVYLTNSFTILKNLSIATKIINLTSTTGNKLIPFVYELIESDRTISYTFSMKNGAIGTVVLNNPPQISQAFLSLTKVLQNSPFKLTVSGTDLDNDQITYRVHWGNGQASDWSGLINPGTAFDYMYQYNTPGNYKIVVEIKDSKESAGQLSESLPITVYSGNGNFEYDFENDIVDMLPMTPPWEIGQTEPSYLRIARNDGFGGSINSCKFVDFDPNIVNNDENGGVAMIVYNQKMKDQGIVQFSCKVSAIDDEFGVRAWQDDNYLWSQLGFYVCFKDGYITYYVDGTFNKIMSIEPDKWYKFELAFNNSLRKFDLTINGSLKGQNLPYGGSSGSLSIFQVVAFSDASCKAAFIDDIKIPVDYLKSAKISKPIPVRAGKISQE